MAMIAGSILVLAASALLIGAASGNSDELFFTSLGVGIVGVGFLIAGAIASINRRISD